MLTNLKKVLLSLILSLLFLLIASPFMYKLTGKVTSSFNFTTSTNGCPNISGLILHSIVFFLLVTIILLLGSQTENYGQSFKGIVKPANMLIVNDLRIEAQNKGCKNVDNVIEQVQLDPYNIPKAKKAVEYCMKNCPGLSKKGLQVLGNIPYA